MARRGVARRSRQGVARQGQAWQGGQGKARQGEIRHGKAVKAGRGKAGHGMAGRSRLVWAGCVSLWRGKAVAVCYGEGRCGLACRVEAVKERNGRASSVAARRSRRVLAVSGGAIPDMTVALG